MWREVIICCLLISASQTRQEEGHWKVQEGQGSSQQVWRQGQEEGMHLLI